MTEISYRAGAVLAALVLLFPPSATAQEPGPAAGVRRAADGTPDLSGVWQVMNTAAWDLEDHHAQKDVPAGGGVVAGSIPYQEWAAAKKKENFEGRATLDPETKCFLPGVPRLTYLPYPFQIVQIPGQVILLHEYQHATRNIYTNGTAHPKGPIEWWLGDSRGRWEGETLVVDTVHFNDQTWFDRAGNFHSSALHVVERFTLSDRDHINYAVTIEDPKVFTRPWQMQMVLYRHTEQHAQILEYECSGFGVEKYYP